MQVPKSLTDLITFTRASSAWRFNASGLLVQEAVNVPRLDHDPATLAPRGLLVEEAATNLCTYSADFSNAAWTKAAASVTAGAGVGPDGAMSLWKVTESTANGSHGVTRGANVVVAEDVDVTMYFVLKAGERRYGRVRIATNMGFLAEVRFDLGAGKVINSAAAVLRDLVPFGPPGSGLWLVSVTARTQVGATSLNGSGFYFWDSPTGGSGGVDAFLGDGVSGLYVFACQVEQRGFCTSYVQTTNAVATRAADVVKVSDLVKIGFKAAQGTLFAEVLVGALGNSATANQFPHMACLTKGGSIGAGDYVGLRLTYPNAVHVNIGNAGAFNNVVPPGSVTEVGAIERLAAAGEGGSIVAARNSAVGAPITTRTWAVDVDTLWIGSQGGGTRYWNGWIRALRYYPRRLADVELQALTT